MKKLKKVAFMVIYVLIIINIVLFFIVKVKTSKIELEINKELNSALEVLDTQTEYSDKEINTNEIESISDTKLPIKVNILENNEEETVIEEEKNESSLEQDNQSFTSIEENIKDDINEVQISEEIIEENISIETQENTIDTTIESNSSGNNIVELAKNYLGFNYVSGGSSPETGFDCSGFTKYIYGQFGISLNRVAADQADNGISINKDELQPGDLLLFHYYGSESIGHTGIYIGDGQFIHAANSNRGVVTDTIESGYYFDNYAGARRVQ